MGRVVSCDSRSEILLVATDVTGDTLGACCGRCLVVIILKHVVLIGDDMHESTFGHWQVYGVRSQSASYMSKMYSNPITGLDRP